MIVPTKLVQFVGSINVRRRVMPRCCNMLKILGSRFYKLALRHVLVHEGGRQSNKNIHHSCSPCQIRLVYFASQAKSVYYFGANAGQQEWPKNYKL